MGKDEYVSIQAELKKLAKLLLAAAEPKYGSAEFDDELKKALDKLPGGEAAGRAIEELKQRAEAVRAAARAARVEAFRRVEAEFVRGAQAEGVPTREVGSGWRVGPLQFEMRREEGRVSCLYNNEQLLPRTAVAELSDLQGLQKKALALLTAQEIPLPELPAVCWEAYQQGRQARRRETLADADQVPAKEFCRELRLALLRRELGASGTGKLKRVEMPFWSFLYNLDRYRALGSSMPEGVPRVGFQTGSQADQKRLGIVVNGLDARQDYRVVCYAVAAAGNP